MTWDFAEGPFGPTTVVVVVPGNLRPNERLPVLVAFHGRGEALKGPARGARGWVDDYGLHRAMQRLLDPPLRRQDFAGLIAPKRLAEHNARLQKHRYGKMIVVCPYLPDILRGDAVFEEGGRLARFVVERVLPRVRREMPAAPSAGATGVDGVSLGGRAALAVGFSRPEAFGSLGAIQPALDISELPRWVEKARAARQRNPWLSIRLLTSDGDYFLEPTRALARDLKIAGIPAELDVATGPHDYAFNRGPGVYEMLLHHEAVLRP